MVTSLVAALLAVAVGLAVGPSWVRFARRARLGKRLNPSEPRQNASKEGTPTLGGVVFLVPLLLVGALGPLLLQGDRRQLIPLGLGAGCAALGAVDDLLGLVGRRRSGGLSPAAKWAGTGALAVAAAVALARAGLTDVRVPLLGPVALAGAVYVPFAVLVLLGTVHAVGITDGLDGLAGTTAGLAFAAFWGIALRQGEAPAAGLCAAAVGALLAFLWVNARPAQTFMGDTGALALGGLLGAVALVLREPFVLLPVGAVFVANAGAVLLQVASRRLRGRRLLRIAPLHNHFQLVGWPETRIVQRFWIIGAIGALVGLLAAAG
jgi:phospho-N-acetylmuramoyl-pentapeptide-transferase